MEDQAFKLGVAVILLIFAVSIVWCWVLYQIMQRIPSDKHQFPSWFIWLFLIPWVGFIFQFIMLPFGIPNTFKRAFPNNQEAISSADMLFKVGLGQVLLTLFGIFFPIRHIADVFAIAGFGLWFAYWYLIVKFKNTYLAHT